MGRSGPPSRNCFFGQHQGRGGKSGFNRPPAPAQNCMDDPDFDEFNNLDHDREEEICHDAAQDQEDHELESDLLTPSWMKKQAHFYFDAQDSTECPGNLQDEHANVHNDDTQDQDHHLGTDNQEEDCYQEGPQEEHCMNEFEDNNFWQQQDQQCNNQCVNQDCDPSSRHTELHQCQDFNSF